MANVTANMDSVFDNSANTVSDFDTMFDQEDSLIDSVEGCNEAGIPITEADILTDLPKNEEDGKVPDEPTTDEGTGKNESPEGTEKDPKITYNDDNEGMKSAIPGTGSSAESKAHCDKAAETALSNESTDLELDNIFSESSDDMNLDTILGESDDEDTTEDTSDNTSDDSSEECTKEDTKIDPKEAQAQATDFGEEPDEQEQDESVDLDTILGESDDEDTTDDTSDDSSEECTKENTEPKDEGILSDDDTRDGSDAECTEDVDLDVVLGSPETKTNPNDIAQSCPDCVPKGDNNLNDAEGASNGTNLDELLGGNEEGIKKSQAPGNHQDVMDPTDDEKKLSESIVVDWSHTHALNEDDIHDMAKEDDTTDDIDVALADSPDPKSSKDLSYKAGEDDELIDLAMAGND